MSGHAISVSSWDPISKNIMKGDVVYLEGKVGNYQECSLSIKGDESFLDFDDSKELVISLRNYIKDLDFKGLRSVSSIQPKFSERKELSLISEIK